MDGDEAHGPHPTPGTLPPSHPTPSQVGDGLGRDGAMLSLGGGGGGARLRLAVLAHQARMDEGARRIDPNPRTPPTSQATILQVGNGLLCGRRSRKSCKVKNGGVGRSTSRSDNHLLSPAAQSTPTHRLRMLAVWKILYNF